MPPTVIDPDAITYENAYEIIDGTPRGRPTDDPSEAAFEDAYEIVDGQILEWPEMGAYPVEVASILHEHLAPFVRQQGLGRTIVEPPLEMTPGRRRRPDLAYISFAQWPRNRRAPNTATWKIVPDLAVEVTSENDEAWKVIDKVREYFDAGVRAVWLVYPNVEVIHVYSSFTQIEVVTRNGTLNGGAVVPGFELPLVDLFEGEADLEAEEAAEPGPSV